MIRFNNIYIFFFNDELTPLIILTKNYNVMSMFLKHYNPNTSSTAKTINMLNALDNFGTKKKLTKSI